MIPPMQAARAAASVDLPPHLSHTFTVLALFWPDVRPTQDQLARLLHCSTRTVNYRLADLERRGRVRRLSGRAGRATAYRLNLRQTAWFVSPHTATRTAYQRQPSTSTATAVEHVYDQGDQASDG